MGWNGGNQYIHYIKLSPKASVAELNNKMPQFMWKYLNKDLEKYGIKDELYFQPFSKIHLHYNPYSASLRRSMLVFSLIAILLLVVVIMGVSMIYFYTTGNAPGFLQGIFKPAKVMQANDEPVPEPISSRRYSGKLIVRIPPEVHRKLAREAAEADISLNRLINAKLSS